MDILFHSVKNIKFNVIRTQEACLAPRDNYGGDIMNSVWIETSKIPKFQELQTDIKTDVLIIGGGIAEILCAHMLKQDNINYVLVEADRICRGVTKNTTAKITSQHGLIYSKLVKGFGLEKTKMYLDANEKAIKMYAKLCNEINCDYKEEQAILYTIDDCKNIEKELSSLNKIGVFPEYTKTLELPFSVSSAIKFNNQAQFNPLKFLAEISKGLKIYENTKVEQLEGTTAITPKGKIRAKKIIIATHFPFINKHGSYFLKMYQSRSYVIAYEKAQNVNGMYIDIDKKGMSFRNYGDLLLIGGVSHRTGKNGGNWEEIEDFSRQYYKSSHEKYRWATQDCITLDGIPYIGNYSANTPNLYVATGFNKWGITGSMVAAMLLRDLVMEKENVYNEVFTPSRTILRPQLIVNSFEATMNMMSLSTKRCPHLGCALKWNKEEQSWDCPCHGSRFTKEGKLINNPATNDLKNKK